MPHTDYTARQVADEQGSPLSTGRDLAIASHRGHFRTRNEDAWASDSDLGVMLVADGVGGQGDGGYASNRVIDLVMRFIVRSVRRTGSPDVTQREKIVARALNFAHKRLHRENQRDALAKPSGTTIVGLWMPAGADMATAFNIGDSSLIHFWAGGAQKVSRDHSLHQLWLDGGQVGTEPSKRFIVQALGISPNLSPHIVSFAAMAGSVIVACSDGLTGTLSTDQIARLLAGSTSATHGATALLEEVLAGQARDNVTVAVCRL